MSMRTLIVLVTAIAMISACGSETAPGAPDPDAVVLEIEFSGGCAQMGPNCSRLVVHGDGTVEAHRIAPGGTELVDSGAIDAGLVIDLYRAVTATDLDALHSKLGPGECRGCYDGIDTTLVFAGSEPVFASVDVELDSSEPLIAAAFAVMEAAQAVVEIPVVAR